MKAIVVDCSTRTIILSSAFAKKAFIHGTSEYEQLKSVRSDFPEFRLDTRQFKTNTKQDRHKGLTYDYMRWYIDRVEDENNAPAVLAGLESLIAISKCHSTGRRYATVKEWFFNRYPNVKTFGMREDELKAFNEEQQKKKTAAASREKNDATASQEKADNVVQILTSAEATLDNAINQ